MAIRWAWVACIVLVAAWLLWRSHEEILGMLRDVSPWLLAMSVLLTVLAKAFLAENARIAALRSGIPLDFLAAARLYNLSQLGKYVPGSIWQFVGRAAAYRARGAQYGPIRDALLIESIWILFGSALAGVLLAGPDIVDIVGGSLGAAAAWWLGGCLFLGVLGVIWLLATRRTLVLRYLRLAFPPLRAVAVQAAVWASLGLSFWVLALACGLQVSLVFATGLFAAAYAVGFLVPFAPAGLGVRDGILTIGLLPYLPAGEALTVSLLARLVYLLVDVGLVLLQEPVFAARGEALRVEGRGED